MVPPILRLMASTESTGEPALSLGCLTGRSTASPVPPPLLSDRRPSRRRRLCALRPHSCPSLPAPLLAGGRGAAGRRAAGCRACDLDVPGNVELVATERHDAHGDARSERLLGDAHTAVTDDA